MPPPSDMYVVKLSFSQYRDFAQWITDRDGPTGTRRYKLPPGPLNAAIEEKLKIYPAQVHERCDGTATRNFDNQDNVITHRDSRSAASKKTNMAMPLEICESNADIDLDYLEGYVRDIKNEPDDGRAAWSLLGMYFLSRCR